MPSKLVLLGLDAVEPTLLRRWASDGTLPAIRTLIDRGTSGSVQGVQGFLGSTWPSFYTGLNPAGHGFHRISQLASGSYGFHRPLDSPAGLGGTPFWKLASDTGRRVAVLDVPLTRLDGSLNGVQIVDWGGHDAISEFETSPPALADEVRRSVGMYPSPRDCNVHGTTAAAFERFVSGLERAVEAKTALTLELLDREEWDLLIQVFTEGHCAGHQCWHLHDPTHPAHDPRTRLAVGDPLERVYRAIDRAMATIAERVGDAQLLLFSAHGMSAHWGASFLLREILYRLGATVHPEAAPPRPNVLERLAETARAASAVLPQGARETLRRARSRVPSRASGPAKNVSTWADVGRSRCFAVPNGSPVSSIRLNLVGREPHGVLRPGPEADAYCRELAADLLAIVDERTGGPLISSVDRTDSLYEGARLDALPDLLVTWSDEIATGSLAYADGRGATVRARSPKLGAVEGRNGYIRTGEHLPCGFFVCVGPGIPASARRKLVQLTDFHPTICKLLGLPASTTDGDVVPELVPELVAARR